MVVDDLRQFLSLLEKCGQLTRVTAEVDPVLEIAAIADRVVRRPGGGPALIFERVKGHVFPVATNLFGSPARIALALGASDLEEPARRLADALATVPAKSSALRLRQVTESQSYRSHGIQTAVSQEVEAEADLTILPALQSWPGDGGRFLTLPMVITRDPEGRPNCGMYRVQIIDSRTATIHFGKESGGGLHYGAWETRGDRMPIAIALGGPPALIYAASAPLAAEVDEVAFAGFLRGKGVPMAQCLTCDLQVPATAEFVLEGYMQPGEILCEGPFGNHTGYYTAPVPSPVFHLLALTRRRDPIYPCTVVGPPPRENLWLGKATERLFLPLLRLEVPEVTELSFLSEGIFHGAALVATEGETDAKDLLRRMWRTELLRRSRLLVLLDADVDLGDGTRVLWRILNHVQSSRDLLQEDGRVGIDARRRTLSGRGEVAVDLTTRARVDRRWPEYGID